jgi:O-antigen ligase
MQERLSKYGFNQLVKEDLNPHNQYLQTGLEIGIFGLAILLLFICLTMISAYNRNDFLMMILISSFAFNMLFESMLQRQSGLVFLSFWVGLLLLKHNRITEFLKT